MLVSQILTLEMETFQGGRSAPSDHNQGTSEHEKRALCVPPQEESASAELDRVMLLWSRLTADEKAQMLIDIEQNGFEST